MIARMPTPPLQLVPLAIEFALLRHEGHYRKRSRVPYIVHPLRIFATLALRVGVRDEATLAAAILHDTIEDTRTDFDEIVERFGEEVAKLVAIVTKDTRLPEAEREAEFTAQVLAGGPKVWIIKIADNYDNLTDRMREGDAQEMRKSALQKRGQIEGICKLLPPEHAWFGEETRTLMMQCIESGGANANS